MPSKSRALIIYVAIISLLLERHDVDIITVDVRCSYVGYVDRRMDLGQHKQRASLYENMNDNRVTCKKHCDANVSSIIL